MQSRKNAGFFEIFIPGIDISAQPLFDQRENVSRLGCDLENPRRGFGQKLAVGFDTALDKMDFTFPFNNFGGYEKLGLDGNRKFILDCQFRCDKMLGGCAAGVYACFIEQGREDPAMHQSLPPLEPAGDTNRAMSAAPCFIHDKIGLKPLRIGGSANKALIIR
jgi:hypothetical protein